MDDDDNLLTSLNKWAERQDENFVTDAFAHLLRHLVRNAPEAAVKILRHLTNGLLDLRAEECPAVEVTTQTTIEVGRPDMEISVPPRFLVYVEVKVGSSKVEGQLEKYLHDLNGSRVERTRLVFLTRFPEDVGQLAQDPQFYHARWSEVATWLHDADLPSHDAVTGFLRNQFVSFLREKGMTMEKVSRELIDGLKAMNSLLAMLRGILHHCGLKTRGTASWANDYIGFWCESKKYWAGMYFEEPEYLYFETGEDFHLAEGAIERTDIDGEAYYYEDGERNMWHHWLDLSRDDGRFFGLSASEQAQELKNFIQRCLATAKQIEAPA
jgi:hypothetical protein